MKRKLSLLLVLVLTFGFSFGAFALNYKATLGNEATFETMAEVRENAPAAMMPFFESYRRSGKYVPHPVMADYPAETTFVYRSSDMYGINAAVRLNTNLVVYTDQSFATKADALDYLKGLGLVDIIEEARGSIVLVTPSDPAKGFTAADQKYYYALQTALFSINATGTQNGEAVTYVDASYYGGYGYLYVIGLDGGATFLNNYVASTFDYVSRIAGLLLVGGTMDRIREVATFVPTYLVNATDAVIAKYEKANGVDALRVEGDKQIGYNQAYPVRKVVTITEAAPDVKAIISDAYYTLFIKSMRGQEIWQGLNSASTPYQGYGADSAPYSLSPRNPIIHDVTPDGIHLITCVDERFSGVKNDAGEYLQTWYEFIPEEALDGSAKEGTIPLILAMHGGGDDPRQFVDGQGLLELAGRERIAILAPEKQNIHTNDTEGKDLLSQVLPVLVTDTLAKYPALDASRVYVTGYSMGALGTIRAAFGAPELFAGAYAQAGLGALSDDDKAKFDNVNLPFMICTSEYNFSYSATLNAGLVNFMAQMMELNGLDPLPPLDYEAYPMAGFKPDIYTKSTLNGDYVQHSWYMTNDDGIPMAGATYVESIIHCLYPQYANMLWDFFKHYSRDLTTGEIIYNPYVR